MSSESTSPAADANASSTMLAVQNLTVSFPAFGSTVVEDISFTIEKGRTVGLVGESGSGKSMSALAIMGLLPEGAEVSGSVAFWGDELLGLADTAMRRLRGDRMAMIFQDPLSSLNPYYTVGFQIAEAYLAHRGGTRRHALSLASEAMDHVRIPDAGRRVSHYPHQFSGGMRQRVMIAMALVCQPDLVIADEPTTALDVTVQAQILTLMSDLQDSTGAGMLFITHDLAVVSEVADSIVVMRNGHTVEQGTAEAIFSRPSNDYTRALLAATPRLDDVVELPEPIREAR
ncbi:ABC transporter ATP-binding protein [Actinopolymorpha pittospori]|uniref:Peptide/nickel transport system ATP-binding protein n=1 Tax=Actinopolymorpha pittospori TaxID=648752 RepID=A0A927MYH0_9ACTN|nr:ABC transporter ATP-binding protein [Actinopolymorpha pittospori]MBE1608889.1 peptide/nickel transport system ATP-binding protein [Actinopolymorpha pittospori]